MNIYLNNSTTDIINILISSLPEYKDKIYLVGGSVRDAVLGLSSIDLDFSVDGDSGHLTDLIWERGIGKNPRKFKKFLCGKIEISGYELEFTSFRKEVYKEKSRFPISEMGTLEDDIYRRDFTVNTLMVNIYDSSFKVIDYTGRGVLDLQNKIIDTPIEPKKSFYEDPLRMFRAIRFSDRFCFELSERVVNAILVCKDRKNIISQKGINSEIMKMSCSAICRCREFGLL